MKGQVETLGERRCDLVQVNQHGGSPGGETGRDPDCDLGAANTADRAEYADAEGRRDGADPEHICLAVQQGGFRRGEELFRHRILLEDIGDTAFEEMALCIGGVCRVVDTDYLAAQVPNAPHQTRRKERADVIDEENLVMLAQGLLRAHDPGPNPAAAVIEQEAMHLVGPCPG